jgi:hypothetical protein
MQDYAIDQNTFVAPLKTPRADQNRFPKLEVENVSKIYSRREKQFSTVLQDINLKIFPR